MALTTQSFNLLSTRSLEKVSAGAIRFFHTSPIGRSTPKFTYGVAAAFTAKDKPFRADRDVFAFNPHNHIVARRKDKLTRPASGQDAFFVSRVGKKADVAFGVTDGVGGWEASGVDPADFSHGICDYMAHAAYTFDSRDSQTVPFTAKSLLQRGYEDICNDPKVRAGGSTACLAIARENGMIDIANLGDSGYVQLRLNAVHNRSQPQTHDFNTPYQLSQIPERVRRQSRFFGGIQIMDRPQDADVYHHAMQHGDIMIFASDGVWDNLTSSDVLKAVSKIMVESRAWEPTKHGVVVSDRLSLYTNDVQEQGVRKIPSLQSLLATAVTRDAKAASINTQVDGPFAREVHKFYPRENWRGGKVDDICVVVAVAVEEGRDNTTRTSLGNSHVG